MGRASNRKKATREARRSTTVTTWGKGRDDALRSRAPEHGQQRMREHIRKAMAAKKPEVSRSPKQAEREAEPKP